MRIYLTVYSDDSLDAAGVAKAFDVDVSRVREAPGKEPGTFEIEFEPGDAITVEGKPRGAYSFISKKQALLAGATSILSLSGDPFQETITDLGHRSAAQALAGDRMRLSSDGARAVNRALRPAQARQAKNLIAERQATKISLQNKLELKLKGRKPTSIHRLVLEKRSPAADESSAFDRKPRSRP